MRAGTPVSRVDAGGDGASRGADAIAPPDGGYMRGMKFGSGKFGARKRAAPGIASATSGVDARG
jgi:hypothetical protein